MELSQLTFRSIFSLPPLSAIISPTSTAQVPDTPTMLPPSVLIEGPHALGAGLYTCLGPLGVGQAAESMEGGMSRAPFHNLVATLSLAVLPSVNE